MAGFWMGKETQDGMNLRLTRALVLLSFVAHLTLALFAGIRRHKDSGVRRFLVRLAYSVTEIGTPIALGKVFLDTTSLDGNQQLKVLVAYREQQMFAFWAPFLVLHLGRPDNITSYALENKGLSPTQVAGLVITIGGAIYGSYKQRFMHGDGALRVAFFIMLFLGSYKYVERAVALHQASFANIRRSNQRKKLRHISLGGKGRDYDDILLDAHGMLGVAMGAFAEYDVKKYNRGYFRNSYGWEDLCNVVKMEASLMYDMFYTKATVIHTWGGYIIRVLSPLGTATALYLFHSKEGQAMESADRMITYILLAGTLGLDVIWLLRALGSTWTYAILVDTEEDAEEESRKQGGNSRLSESDKLKKAGRRPVRQLWYWLHRLLLCLDPLPLSLRSGQSGHRLLSVGQCNLLHDCITPPEGRPEKMVRFFTGVGKKKKIDVKDDLLEVMSGWGHNTKEVAKYFRSDSSSEWGFESIVIALHVATDIFLLCKPGIESEASPKYKMQIRGLSDYMMFLIAERKHMVLKPGEEASDYDKTCLDLKEIWRKRRTSGFLTTRKTELAVILLEMDGTDEERKWEWEKATSSLLYERNHTLGLGADWALKMLRELDPATSYGQHPVTHKKSYGRHTILDGYIRGVENLIPVFTQKAKTQMKEHRDRGEQSKLLDYVLRLIRVSWVRLLTFTSAKCSTESHAKQLSCGGELLTLVWLMKPHETLDTFCAAD